jgi:acyl-CoA thioesterase-1
MVMRSIHSLERLVALAAALALTLLDPIGAAQAETIRIVAIGASNTAGRGVGWGEAWPARLEALLKARGQDVTISVSAVVGDTSAGILQRIDGAVPEGTRVVVYDVGAGNDRDAGAAEGIAANRAQIEQRIRARGAKPVFAAYARIVGRESANPSAWQANDIHHL